MALKEYPASRGVFLLGGQVPPPVAGLEAGQIKASQAGTSQVGTAAGYFAALRQGGGFAALKQGPGWPCRRVYVPVLQGPKWGS